MYATDHRSLRPRAAAGRSRSLLHAGAIPPPAAFSLTPPHLAGALLGSAALAYLLPGLAGAWPALRGPLGVEDHTASGRGYALTFDDGPHAQGTPAALEILAAADVHATFFLVGEQVARAPALAREILAAGHAIGLHCHRHRNLLRLAPWQVAADLDRAQAVIEDATGRSPGLYRPPYGVLNAAALTLARRRGWRTLLWTHWGRDWEARATPASIARRVTAGAGAGSVLLLHDADDYSAPGSWRRTAEALPRVLDALAERGLEAVSP
jgi:peptidoglycan/xylan/chitin deacetylase (PgdA/CDA1 family)